MSVYKEGTSGKTICPDCGYPGAHYCVGKSYKPEQPKGCNIDFPAFDNPPYPVPMPQKKRMTQAEIKEFSKWLKENDPSLVSRDFNAQYWELFAYRIVERLGL